MELELDLILTLITVAIVGWFTVADWFTPKQRVNHLPEKLAEQKRIKPVRYRSRRSNQMNTVQPHQNAVERRSTVHSNVQQNGQQPVVGEGTAYLSITEKELQQLASALAARAAGQSKQAAIEAAFGVKKGGSIHYQRASMLYDRATSEQ
jgi:hypothetical protein